MKDYTRINIKRPYPNLTIEAAVSSLSSGLARLAQLLEEILTEICSKDEDFEKTSLFQQGGEYMQTCRAWSGILEDCFRGEREKEENNCSYLECSRNKWSFCIAPLEVAGLFYSKVLSGCESLLLTSATLAEKNGYARSVRALGFERMEEERVVFADPLPMSMISQNSVLVIPSDSPQVIPNL